MAELTEFCDWLSRTRLSVAIGSIEWVVPAVQTLHILLIAVVASSALLLDLRLLGIGRQQHSLAEAAGRFLPALWLALPGLALTGLVLIVAEPARELTNLAFGAKMGLLMAVIALTWWFQRGLRGRQGGEGRARLVGIASLILWLAIIAAGRGIAYVQEL